MKNNIPKKAKKVFKGVIYDVYHWPQKKYDGTKTTFEGLKRADTVEVIAVTHDQKIIIQEQKQPGTNWFYSLPGGRIDKGEKPLKAAHREFFEETGYLTKSMKLYKKIASPYKISWSVYYYIARDIKKVSKPCTDGGELFKYKYLTFDQFLKLSEEDKFLSKDLRLIMFEARINKKKYNELKKTIYE